MTTPTYKHEWTLELPKLTSAPYQGRNLCVQVQQSQDGNYRAVLVDLGEGFRGEGSVQGLAIDDLANELEHVAAEIRRESSFDRDLRHQLEQLRRAPPAVSAAPSIHELREVLAQTIKHAGVLTAMLDDLARLRAKERLRADQWPPAVIDDLPPDGLTGLYLDQAIAAEDLGWIKMAWDTYLSRGNGSGPPRPAQLMLVFQAIRRDERSTAEFLRVMNTIVLPLLRRLRLKDQPQLSKLGAVSE